MPDTGVAVIRELLDSIRIKYGDRIQYFVTQSKIIAWLD